MFPYLVTPAAVARRIHRTVSASTGSRANALEAVKELSAIRRAAQPSEGLRARRVTS